MKSKYKNGDMVFFRMGVVKRGVVKNIDRDGNKFYYHIAPIFCEREEDFTFKLSQDDLLEVNKSKNLNTINYQVQRLIDQKNSTLKRFEERMYQSYERRINALLR